MCCDKMRNAGLKSKLEMKSPHIGRFEKGKAYRYSVAVLAAVIAVLMRLALSPVLHDRNAYHTAWLGVIFSAWYCGVGPAIVTAIIELLSVWYWLLPPTHSFALQNPKVEIPGMISFLVFSGCIIALGETNRRSLQRSKQTEGNLRLFQEELEKKVEERTAELNSATDSLRELSARLQQLSDDERRRIARELHDGIGQLLAAFSMNNAAMQAQIHKLDSAAARAFSDNIAITDQISREIRTLSHLLHPPLLDIAGLASAIRWYVDGFTERSGIKVDLSIPENLGRLSDEREIAIFRMIQECLTNVHRHSAGATVSIRVQQQDHTLLAEVQDAGKGISSEKQRELNSSGGAGVGFRGMRERLRQLGGTLEIHSDANGTAVRAMLPTEVNPADTTESAKRRA
jgi:signal transduction histidine kinase